MKTLTMLMLKKVGLVLLLSIGLAACASGPVQLGSSADEKYDATHPREISARACGFQLFTFIPIRTNSRLLRAQRALQRQAGEDYIADTKISEEWTYAYVGTLYCTTMDATAYPRLKL